MVWCETKRISSLLTAKNDGDSCYIFYFYFLDNIWQSTILQTTISFRFVSQTTLFYISNLTDVPSPKSCLILGIIQGMSRLVENGSWRRFFFFQEVSKWPAAGHAIQNTQWPALYGGSSFFPQNIENYQIKSTSNVRISKKNQQAIQKAHYCSKTQTKSDYGQRDNFKSIRLQYLR